MSRLSDLLRSRIVPAVLAATGVSLIAGGLLTYTGAAEVPSPQPSPTIIATLSPRPTLVLPTLPPPSSSPSSSLAPSPSAVSDRVATRVRVEALKIDLAVIRQPDPDYPACNVAMYHEAFGQPGSGRATYLFAHARDGMFGPIYERAIRNRNGGPESMLGMQVEVWTSDDMLFTYQIVEVKLHQLTLNEAIRATTEELWLQTSEGPRGTPGKTMLKALPLVVLPANPADAHPRARPVDCE